MPTLSDTLRGLAGVAAFWSAGAAAALSLVEPGGPVDTDLDTLVIALYVKIDDTLQQAPELRPWRPAVGIAPKLTDAELLTPGRGSTTPEIAHVALLMMRGPGPHVEPPP